MLLFHGSAVYRPLERVPTLKMLLPANIPLPPSLSPEQSPLILQVTAAAERQIRHGLPWLKPEDIRSENRTGQVGDWAIVLDRKRRHLAVGLYDPQGPVRVRCFPLDTPAPPDETWLSRQIAAANQQRAFLRETQTTGYRILHGENDGLPGLALDRYDQVLVLKLYTAAWIPHLHLLLAAIKAVLPLPQLVLRLSDPVLAQPELLFHLEDGLTLWGEEVDEPVLFEENGLVFEADVVSGLRTGFFFDQRDNRALVETISEGKTVLIGYAHTGSFPLYAARGGARHVVSLSASQPALAMAIHQFERNQATPTIAAADHELLMGDVLLTLSQLHQSQRRFDVVVLIPPPFAHEPDKVESALDLYNKLTRRALHLLRPQGLLFITSRSGAIPAETFYETIHKTATRLWRPLEEIQRTGQPLDHPITFPEAGYLKGLLVRT